MVIVRHSTRSDSSEKNGEPRRTSLAINGTDACPMSTWTQLIIGLPEVVPTGSSLAQNPAETFEQGRPVGSIVLPLNSRVCLCVVLLDRENTVRKQSMWRNARWHVLFY